LQRKRGDWQVGKVSRIGNFCKGRVIVFVSLLEERRDWGVESGRNWGGKVWEIHMQLDHQSQEGKIRPEDSHGTGGSLPYLWLPAAGHPIERNLQRETSSL